MPDHQVDPSGETLSADITGRLPELAPRATIVNSYGSSEVVGDVTFAAVDAATADPVPIGRPVPGTEILVLDAALRPTPVVWSAKSMSLQHNSRAATHAGRV